MSGSRGLCQNQQLQGWAFWMGTLVFDMGYVSWNVSWNLADVHQWRLVSECVCSLCVAWYGVCCSSCVVCEVCVCVLQKLLDVHAVWCEDSWPFLWMVSKVFS